MHVRVDSMRHAALEWRAERSVKDIGGKALFGGVAVFCATAGIAAAETGNTLSSEIDRLLTTGTSFCAPGVELTGPLLQPDGDDPCDGIPGNITASATSAPTGADKGAIGLSAVNDRLAELRDDDLDLGLDTDGPIGGSGGGHASDQFGAIGVFANLAYTYTDREQSRFSTDFVSHAVTASAGADLRVNENIVFGAALSYGHTFGDFGRVGGDFETNDFGVNMYGQATLENNTSFNIGVGYNYGMNDYKRVGFWTEDPADTDSAVTSGSAIIGEAESHTIVANIGAGHSFSLGAVQITPRADIVGSFTSIPGYVESGDNGVANGLELDYGSRSTQSLTFAPSVTVQHPVAMNSMVVIPSANIGYRYEMFSDRDEIDASLVFDANSNPINFDGAEKDAHVMTVGAGVAMAHDTGTSAYVDYNTVLLHEYQSEHTIRGGVRVPLN